MDSCKFYPQTPLVVMEPRVTLYQIHLLSFPTSLLTIKTQSGLSEHVQLHLPSGLCYCPSLFRMSFLHLDVYQNLNYFFKTNSSLISFLNPLTTASAYIGLFIRNPNVPVDPCFMSQHLIILFQFYFCVSSSKV